MRNPPNQSPGCSPAARQKVDLEQIATRGTPIGAGESQSGGRWRNTKCPITEGPLIAAVLAQTDLAIKPDTTASPQTMRW
jgi:hypothetical protein